jgi:hypothetical protein
MPPPDQQGTDAFWRQYGAAESMDHDVRKELDKRKGSRYGRDLVWLMLHGDEHDKEFGAKHVVGAIEDELEKRGMLDALNAEEARADLGLAQQQLRLAA